ncbi:MAG: patatin-like phospholipase family protein, partial [Rhodoglobus sp.]
MKNNTRALVLGGGGLTGIAWETGLLIGLQRRGIDLTSAALIVGTSAGSVVAAQVAVGAPLERLYQNQLDAVVSELPGKLGGFDIVRLLVAMLGRDEKKALARVGGYAINAQTPDESVRRAVIEQRLPVHEWPSAALKIAATDAETGELVV